MRMKRYNYNPYIGIIDILLIFMVAICIIILIAIQFRDKEEDIKPKEPITKEMIIMVQGKKYKLVEVK